MGLLARYALRSSRDATYARASANAHSPIPRSLKSRFSCAEPRYYLPTAICASRRQLPAQLGRKPPVGRGRVARRLSAFVVGRR